MSFDIRNMKGFAGRVANCPGCGDGTQVDGINSFAVYYEDRDVERPRFMMVMQNPGGTKGVAVSDEGKDLAQVGSSEEFVAMTRKYLSKWLKKSNRSFSESFFGILKKYKLISYDNLDNYLDCDFYNHFLVTDLVKCRVATRDVDDKRGDLCGERFLRTEIEKAKNVDLIFSFSTRTWRYMKGAYLASQGVLPTVVQAHGRLYRMDGCGKCIIPLAHFSRTMLQKYLRLSYYQYFEEGVCDYAILRGINSR
ncbi:uracil-DNA glycosylase family protein [Fundidesulfovibrio magnetotacticus]|uniref:uracil-DNA glycosylase family protein n=1 Tax=Fundidesulfovibrio magnetotacticus TaxID=2730080 RepID=UPI00156669BE|nr:uracil-DNA glycosylase family protein [Fundidesulfovibrio magnetotacticus]